MKDCNQCGKCCIKYGNGALSATKEEIDLWELFNPEIFKYVSAGEIWVDPESGRKLERCPFLQLEPNKNNTASIKYICSIYESRPEDCRHYPSLISEMIKDECEMIEITDLQKPKQAQVKLDYLMRDSRPGYSS
jgi:Fe-S-cluster containining protein